MKLDTSPDTI